MFVFRCVALFLGVDRLPLTPSVIDEVIINDPAVALSRGYGLVAFSFEHSHSGLDRMYGHFPPLFIVLQALVFRLFGFSVFTLRAPSVLFDLAAGVVFLAILLELRHRAFAETWAVALAGLLILLEPTTLVHSREGRMESLVVLLGGLALYLAMRAERSARNEKALWFAGSIAVGLALSTHLAAVMMWAAFTLWSLRRFQRLGTGLWLTINSLPILVLLFAWSVAHRSGSLAAFRQMRLIASYSPAPSLRLESLASSIGAGNMQALISTSGAPALLCAIAILGFALGRLAMPTSGIASKTQSGWRPALTMLTAILAAQCLLVQFVVPNSGWNRILIAVPLAFVCLAAAVSYLRWQSAWALISLMLLLVAGVQVLMDGFYLEQMRQDWTARSPDRFDAVLRSIPEHASVAAAPQFWYAFLERKQRFAVIDASMEGTRYYLEAPGAFDGFDFVILNPAAPDYAPMLAKAQIKHPVQFLAKTFKQDFVVLAKDGQSNSASARK
jgi:uncharacterized membrane protein